MTEADWVACNDPQRILIFLQGNISDRKLRLFICQCSRHLLRSLTTDFDEDLEWAELYADGHARPEDLSVIRSQLLPICEEYAPDWYRGVAKAVTCALEIPLANSFGVREATLQVLNYYDEQEHEELSYQASLLRELVGVLPFRSVLIDRPWLTPSVIALAQDIYNRRVFERLPDLADGLEEAGCTDADILAHCRWHMRREAEQVEFPNRRVDHTGRVEGHARGCWVVDLLLGLV